MCYNWCTCLLKNITRGKFCQSKIQTGGSQPKLNVAIPGVELGLQLYIGFHYIMHCLENILISYLSLCLD